MAVGSVVQAAGDVQGAVLARQRGNGRLPHQTFYRLSASPLALACPFPVLFRVAIIPSTPVYAPTNHMSA